jgi:esterase/lipase superfamily enzyme
MQAITEVLTLMEVHKDEVTSITVTGHSLGGSLATLNAVDMVAHYINMPLDTSSKQQPCPVTAILFASPRVGNDAFKHAFASFPELRALGVINENDIVPNLPPEFLGYADAATATLPIDTTRSPYLRRPGNPLTFHNLSATCMALPGIMVPAAPSNWWWTVMWRS